MTQKQEQSDITRKVDSLSDGRQAVLVETPPDKPANKIVATLGLKQAEAVILFLGGDCLSGTERQARLLQLFNRGLAHVVDQHGGLIIDVGTNCEVIKELSEALADSVSKVPLLRVVADSGSQLGKPVSSKLNGNSESTLLESKHTHCVVLKSSIPGAEIDRSYEIAWEVSKDVPILTVLVSGNAVAKDALLKSIRQEWPILVIKDSGGFADEIEHEWQARQNYVQQLTAWKQAQQANPEPTPPFIADQALAEVVADGDLHFFSLTGTPEDLVQCIDGILQQYTELKLKASDILKQVGEQQKLYSSNARRQQTTFRRQQGWILLLGVFITALAAFQAFCKQVHWNPSLSLVFWQWSLENVVYVVLLSVPIGLAILIAGANRFDAGKKWISLRVAAEAIKRERYRYRTHTGIYNDVQVAKNETSREATLSTMLESITKQWVEGTLEFGTLLTDINLSYFALTRRSIANAAKSLIARLPWKKKAAPEPEDRGYGYLSPNDYIKYRLLDQLNYYRKNARKLARKLWLLQWLILILGGIITLLAALQSELLITVVTACATALTTYLEYQQVNNTLKQYNYAILSLTRIQNWWAALEDAQKDAANIDKLVDDTETTLQSEQAGWVQQMQTALTELRMQQAKQGKDAPTTASTNKSLEDHLPQTPAPGVVQEPQVGSITEQ